MFVSVHFFAVLVFALLHHLFMHYVRVVSVMFSVLLSSLRSFCVCALRLCNCLWLFCCYFMFFMFCMFVVFRLFSWHVFTFLLCLFCVNVSCSSDMLCLSIVRMFTYFYYVFACVWFVFLFSCLSFHNMFDPFHSLAVLVFCYFGVFDSLRFCYCIIVFKVYYVSCFYARYLSLSFMFIVFCFVLVHVL